jgi:tyrosyl-tRNA synthetase
MEQLSTSTSFLDELAWRGMINQQTPGLAEHLAKGKRVGYIGFDPTASSLHIGNLATLNLLLHFAKAGHKPVALLGGATGMIGDPSGKSEERKLLNATTILDNVASQKEQIIDLFTRHGYPDIAVVNNMDWYRPMSIIDFLRDIGKTLTVNYMAAKDSVKSRMETGISFTEFSYQLLQGYDFVELNRQHSVTLQMGGADQWGNMTSGTEMLRRLDQTEGEVLTTPLVTKADGSKFGKSEGGNVWLDPTLTSPYKFYQFWLNVGDEEVERYLKVFTFLSQEALITIINQHISAPHLRQAQKKLAEEVTRFVHGDTALLKAIESTQLLFGGGTFEQWKALSESELLDLLSGVPQYKLTLNDEDLLTQLSAGTDNQLFTSKGEARKMIAGGGLALNLQKASGEEKLADLELLFGKYILGQKGKKNFFLLEIA